MILFQDDNNQDEPEQDEPDEEISDDEEDENVESESGEISNEESDEDESDYEDDGSVDETGLVQEESGEPLEMIDDFEPTIKKCRKIVNTFHGRSTPQVDYLQDAVKKWQKEKVIILRHILYQIHYIVMHLVQ